MPFEKLYGNLRRYHSKSIAPLPQIMNSHLARNCIIRKEYESKLLFVHPKNYSNIKNQEKIELVRKYLNITQSDSIIKISKLIFKNKIYKSLVFKKRKPKLASNDSLITFNSGNTKKYGEIVYFVEASYNDKIKVLIYINEFAQIEYQFFDPGIIFVQRIERKILIDLNDIIGKFIIYNFVNHKVIGIKEVL